MYKIKYDAVLGKLSSCKFIEVEVFKYLLTGCETYILE